MATKSAPTFTTPPSFSPDTLDALTSLAHDLARVRAGLLQNPDQQPSPGDNKQPLAIKDVPGATDAIKHKIQRARAAVKALPDMERGVEEQEREVKELEGRIERQRAVLRGLRERGEGRDDDEKMVM
ncbi:hypothetical protein CC79DRAFT_1366415 [Sarocladium strictum]